MSRITYSQLNSFEQFLKKLSQNLVLETSKFRVYWFNVEPDSYLDDDLDSDDYEIPEELKDLGIRLCDFDEYQFALPKDKPVIGTYLYRFDVTGAYGDSVSAYLYQLGNVHILIENSTEDVNFMYRIEWISEAPDHVSLAAWSFTWDPNAKIVVKSVDTQSLELGNSFENDIFINEAVKIYDSTNQDEKILNRIKSQLVASLRELELSKLDSELATFIESVINKTFEIRPTLEAVVRAYFNAILKP